MVFHGWRRFKLIKFSPGHVITAIPPLVSLACYTLCYFLPHSSLALSLYLSLKKAAPSLSTACLIFPAAASCNLRTKGKRRNERAREALLLRAIQPVLLLLLLMLIASRERARTQPGTHVPCVGEEGAHNGEMSWMPFLPFLVRTHAQTNKMMLV